MPPLPMEMEVNTEGSDWAALTYWPSVSYLRVRGWGASIQESRIVGKQQATKKKKRVG